MSCPSISPSSQKAHTLSQLKFWWLETRSSLKLLDMSHLKHVYNHSIPDVSGAGTWSESRDYKHHWQLRPVTITLQVFVTSHAPSYFTCGKLNLKIWKDIWVRTIKAAVTKNWGPHAFAKDYILIIAQLLSLCWLWFPCFLRLLCHTGSTVNTRWRRWFRFIASRERIFPWL